MKQFLAIYTGSPEAMARWGTLPEAERAKRQQEGVAAWHTWVEKNKASLVDMGGPLGRTKRVGIDGITDIRNAMAAYTVVKAETHEDAAKLFMNHPHFTMFPGEAVEVMECLPIPG